MDRPVRKVWLPGIIALVVLSMLPATVVADEVGLAVLGDSVSDTYVLRPYAPFASSWTDLLGTFREGKLRLYNQARAGANSASLREQAAAVAEYVRQGKVCYVCVIIGANDFRLFVERVANGSQEPPDPVVTTLVENIRAALDTIEAAGPVGVVLANVPDLGDTPGLAAWIASSPVMKEQLTRGTREANRRLEALARERRIPVIDLHGRTLRARESLRVGGVEVQDAVYAFDGLHPSTVSSALLGNAVLEALHRAYGLDISELRLTDREALAGIGRVPLVDGYADVSSFVLFDAPKPAPIVARRSRFGWTAFARIALPCLAATGLLGCWRWRRRPASRER
jgi:lysophospholipase L1-like esterase